MQISKWRRRRYVPEWGGNREDAEPCVLVFHPPTVEIMGRWRELALSSPLTGGEEKIRSTLEDNPDALGDWTSSYEEFRSSLFEDLIVAVENLTDGEKALDRSECIAFIMEHEGLREEVFRAIVEEGSLSAGEGKASG